MQQQYGFTKIELAEFENWLSNQSISRTCVRVQEHHTWKPRYSGFDGTNHFEMQRNMKRYHINNNGFNDIGQHFSIFPDGVILTGRPLNRSPACVLHANSGAICIENVGNFDAGGDTMTSDQAESIFRVTAALLKKIGIQSATKSNVVYHHWYDGDGSLVYFNSGQKSCPGTAFFGGNQLSDFETNFLPKLQDRMGGGGNEPVGLLDWVVVTADTLNVRSGPSSSHSLSNEQGPLDFGSVVRVYEKTDSGWIRISQSKQLWVFERYTEAVVPATVNTADTNGRVGPGASFEVDRVFQVGDRVFIQQRDGEWCNITELVWIHETLLST